MTKFEKATNPKQPRVTWTNTYIELIKRENNSPQCWEEKEVTSSPCSTKGHGESTGQVHTRFSAARSRLLLATQGSPRSRSRGPCPFGDTTSSKKTTLNLLTCHFPTRLDMCYWTRRQRLWRKRPHSAVVPQQQRRGHRIAQPHSSAATQPHSTAAQTVVCALGAAGASGSAGAGGCVSRG